MIRNGDLLRFTPDEIDEFRSAGLDVAHVRTIEDFGAAVAAWCDLLAEVRPHLLEKVARDGRGARSEVASEADGLRGRGLRRQVLDSPGRRGRVNSCLTCQGRRSGLTPKRRCSVRGTRRALPSLYRLRRTAAGLGGTPWPERYTC